MIATNFAAITISNLTIAATANLVLDVLRKNILSFCIFGGGGGGGNGPAKQNNILVLVRFSAAKQVSSLKLSSATFALTMLICSITHECARDNFR